MYGVNWTFICNLMIELEQYIVWFWTHSHIYTQAHLPGENAALYASSCSTCYKQPILCPFLCADNGGVYAAQNSFPLQGENQGPLELA